MHVDKGIGKEFFSKKAEVQKHKKIKTSQKEDFFQQGEERVYRTIKYTWRLQI